MIGVFTVVILEGFCSIRDIGSHFPSAFIWGVAVTDVDGNTNLQDEFEFQS